MYAQLYEYFLLHKQLSIPGIGSLRLSQKPAETDFPNKQVTAPSYSVNMSFPAGVPASHFYKWLGEILGISDREAVIRFNDFAFDMRRQIINGSVINWDGIGTFSKGLAGEIKFAPALTDVMPEKPVAANKVLREKADHMVRVGEEERSAEEMSELLAQSGKKQSLWWAWALIAGSLAVMFLGWYFSEQGTSVESVGVNTKLAPEEAAATYQLIP